MRVALLCIAVIASLGEVTAYSQQPAAVQRSAVVDVLGRELPIAIERRGMKALREFFAEDVVLTMEVPDAMDASGMVTLAGRDNVTRAFDWNPTRVTPKVSGVLIGRRAIVLTSNVEGANGLLPRSDTFWLNSEMKIYRIESVVGNFETRGTDDNG